MQDSYIKNYLTMLAMCKNDDEMVEVLKKVHKEGRDSVKLSEVQYNATIQAINNAKSAIDDDEFIDYYSEYGDMYTNDELKTALNEVDTILSRVYVGN